MSDLIVPRAKEYLTNLLVTDNYPELWLASHNGWKDMKEAQGYKYGPVRSAKERTNPNLQDWDFLSPETQRSNKGQSRAVLVHFRRDLKGHESMDTLVRTLKDYYELGTRYLLGEDDAQPLHFLGTDLHEFFVSGKVSIGYTPLGSGLSQSMREDLITYPKIPPEYQMLNVMSGLWIIGGLIKKITGEDPEPLPKSKPELVKPYVYSNDPSEPEKFLTMVLDSFMYYGFARGIHEAWAELKRKQGWVYGEVTDRAKKINKNLVLFDKLEPAVKFSNVVTPRATVLHFLNHARKHGLDMSAMYGLFNFYRGMRKGLDQGSIPRHILDLCDAIHETFWTAKQAAGDPRTQEGNLVPLEILAKDVISWDAITGIDTLDQMSNNPLGFGQ